MTHHTVKNSTFEAYLEFEASDATSDLTIELDETKRWRDEQFTKFPFPLMLELAFAELDFANRWCWQNFGPANGECQQRHSEYPACLITEVHSHIGNWQSHWYVKTDYNYGFNEWYFAHESHRDKFRENVDLINWGENYPKTSS